MDDGRAGMQDGGANADGIGSRHAAEVAVTDQAPDEEGRFLATGDESGTGPGDRKFRPDVEGLRAIAILLVVLFHADVPGVTGGYVGVDVFFVISGFVITGLLLREHATTGKSRLGSFYGRRCRRILPAATVVIIATVVASYRWLGFLTGDDTARVARTASLFVANFHFIASGTNYLASEAPPSALQNFWSLSVEEQFYVVYPTLFIVAALCWKRLDIRVKLSALLVAGIVASFVWSVHETPVSSVTAFFSPFTRAWELALGSMVAVGSLQLRRIPPVIAAAMSWLGLAGIVTAAFVYSASTPYPGSAVALPVISTALVIAGGTAHPFAGAEVLLGLPPFRWLGKLSYSLYLWHWPILIIAAQHVGHPLSVEDNLLWVLFALVLSIFSYLAIENPIRHWSFLTIQYAEHRAGRCVGGTVLSHCYFRNFRSLMRRHIAMTGSSRRPLITACLAVFIVALTCSACSSSPTSSATTTAPPPSTAPSTSVPPSTAPPSTTPQATASTLPPSPEALAVLQSINDASKITTLPSNLTPALEDFANPAQAKMLWGPWFVRPCDPYVVPSEASNPTPCIFGDASSTRTIVLVGDSNVGNWAPALDSGLKAAGYRLAVFAFASCPTPDLTYPSPSYGTLTGTLLTECNQWHQTVTNAISALHPLAVIAASGSTYLKVLSDQQWISGFTKLFDDSTVGNPSAVRILMGTSPFPAPSPNCLAATSNPQTCAFSFTPGSESPYSAYVKRDALIAAASNATLIPTYPWFCHAGTCSPVVSNYLVYADTDHATIAYSQYLAPVVTSAVLNAIASHP